MAKPQTKSGVRNAADPIVLECALAAGPGNGDSTFYNEAVELVKASYTKRKPVAALSGKEKLFDSGEGRNAERAVNHVIEKQRKAG